MNSGLCLCVLLVAVSASCLRRTCCSAQREVSAPAPSRHARHARAAQPPMPALSRHARSVEPPMPATDGTGASAVAAANLSELLTKLMARKAFLRKNSLSKSRASGVGTNHQIKDRDYLGWMDFGRRSAEEYEYSS